MIRSVEITRLRGIRQGKLEDLTPLVVLVGPNGCGKSTVLDALLIGGTRQRGEEIERAVQRHQGVKYGARWLFWKTGTEGSCQIKTTADNDLQRHLRLVPQAADEANRIFVDIDVDNLCRSRSVATGKVRLRFVRTDKTAGGGRLAVLDRDIPCPPQQNFQEIRLVEGHLDDPARPIHRVFAEVVEQGRLDEAKAIVTALAAEVKDVPMASEGDDPLVFFGYDDRGVPAALAGDGVYSLLRLSLGLASLPESTVLLEEPELHQHPGAIRQTVRAILAAVRRDIQVVITTHSLELIDSILAESSEEDVDKLSLYRLQLENGFLISHRLPGSEVVFSRSEIEKDLR